MAIENGDADPAMVRQCFVSFQPVMDMMNPLPQALGIHQRVYTSDRVSTLPCQEAFPLQFGNLVKETL